MAEGDTANGLGAWITRKRAQAGLSRYRLARLAQIDGSQLLRVEQGQAGLSPASLLRVAHALEAPVEEAFAAAGFDVSENAEFISEERRSLEKRRSARRQEDQELLDEIDRLGELAAAQRQEIKLLHRRLDSLKRVLNRALTLVDRAGE